MFPGYLAEVDHREPVIPVDATFALMTLDEVANRIWCELDKLQVLDEACHSVKTKAENKLRRECKKKGRKV